MPTFHACTGAGPAAQRSWERTALSEECSSSGIFFSFDAVCLGRITWARGSTVILLTRHKQRGQHVLSSSRSARASHEARATRTIPALASAFVFYLFSCTSALYVTLTASPGSHARGQSCFLHAVSSREYEDGCIPSKSLTAVGKEQPRTKRTFAASTVAAGPPARAGKRRKGSARGELSSSLGGLPASGLCTDSGLQGTGRLAGPEEELALNGAGELGTHGGNKTLKPYCFQTL
ncbi:hypothetical protein CB1_000989003 [Camelus ferus]|nr:hypothetical protein CB1_000989003 [Camelus ferus]